MYVSVNQSEVSSYKTVRHSLRTSPYRQYHYRLNKYSAQKFEEQDCEVTWATCKVRKCLGPDKLQFGDAYA